MISTPEHRRDMGEKKRKTHYQADHEFSGLRFIFPEDGASILKLPDSQNLSSLSKQGIEENTLSFDNARDRKKISEFYFKIKKHEELYSLGKSFSIDLEKRDNAFGFYNLSGETNEETIVALTSFFSNQLEMNPLIVTCNSNLSKYREIVGELEVKEFQTKALKTKFKIYNASGFYILDLDSFYDSHSESQYKQILSDVVEMFPSSFWDMPQIQKIKESPEKYFVAFSFMNNMSLIVNFKNSNVRKTKEVIDFFHNYSLKLKGFILD